MTADEIVRALASTPAPTRYVGGGDEPCAFCDASMPASVPDHKIDCPWRQANEWVPEQFIRGSRERIECPVPGCPTRYVVWDAARRSTYEGWMAAHAAHRHVRCSCGWVGLGFGQHRSGKQRYDGSSEMHTPVPLTDSFS